MSQCKFRYHKASTNWRDGLCRNAPCEKKARTYLRHIIEQRNANNFHFSAWKFCSRDCFTEFRSKRTDGAAERVAAFLAKKGKNAIPK